MNLPAARYREGEGCSKNARNFFTSGLWRRSFDITTLEFFSKKRHMIEAEHVRYMPDAESRIRIPHKHL